MSEAPPRAGDPQPRVLLVDDEWLMVEVMTAVLRKLSFTDIDVAADGAAALAMLQQKDYGLVVSDLTMQPMTGLELLHAVRRNPSLRDLPFILTTTAANGQHAAAAKRLGVDGFLLKPFTPAQLADKIASVRRRPSRPPAGRDEEAGRGQAEADSRRCRPSPEGNSPPVSHPAASRRISAHHGQGSLNRLQRSPSPRSGGAGCRAR